MKPEAWEIRRTGGCRREAEQRGQSGGQDHQPGIRPGISRRGKRRMVSGRIAYRKHKSGDALEGRR